jgi:hypothetical protein
VPYPQLIRFPEPVRGDVQGRHRDWLEVYGETKPTMNWGTVKAPANGGLYEYRWGFGYSKASFSDPRPKTESRWRGRRSKRSHSERLDYPAAHVRLFFAADCNWRVSEILATVKHLSPVQEEQTWREELAKDFTAIAPVIGVAGKAAADAAGMPELGSVAEAVGRLKLTSVPQANGAKWFVRRIDRVWSKSLFHGIEWELSLGLLLQLGTRVTGGLLTSFASTGGDSGTCDHSIGLLAQAVMHYDADRSQDVWLPPEDEPLELTLKPIQPI